MLMLPAICLTGFFRVASGQTVIEKEIVFEINGKAQDIHTPLKLGDKDTVTGRFRFVVENNTQDTKWVTFCMLGLSDGKFFGSSTSGSSLSPGESIEIDRKLSSHIADDRRGKTLEIRWYLRHEPGPKKSAQPGQKEIIEYSDFLNCCGQVFLNKPPVELETLAAQMAPQFEHEDNWLGLNKWEIVDALYFMRRQRIIVNDSDLAKTLADAGKTFAGRFRAIDEQRSDKDLEYDKQSLAIAVAKQNQWEAIEEAITAEQLSQAIIVAGQQRFANVYVKNQPGDVAYLGDPKVGKLIELDEKVAGELSEISAKLTTELKKRIKGFKKELPKWEEQNRPKGDNNDREARNKFKSLRAAKIDAHIKHVNDRKKDAFDAMMLLLNEEQNQRYKKYIALDEPAKYIFRPTR